MGLAALTLASLLAAGLHGPTYGLALDEPAYFESAARHRAWFDGGLRAPGSRLAYANLYFHWGEDLVRDAHPPLVKIAAAALVDPGAVDPYARVRWVGALAFALGGALLAAAALERWGARAAVLALLAWVGLPRVFGHGHLLLLDLPVAVACFAVGWAQLRWIDAPPTAARVATVGGLLGLALLTKLNGFFAPLPALLALALRGRLRDAARWAACYPIALAVLYAGWPRLWRDPIGGFARYVGFHAGHFPVPVYYLGEVTSHPAWHYSLVLLAASLPLATAALALVALHRGRRGWRTAFGLGAALSFALPLALIAAPFTPAYDGVRLFLPAFPWVALAAGRGADLLARRVAARSRPAATGLTVALALGLVLPAALAREWAPDYYGAQVGGAPGAEALGFETTTHGTALGPEVWAWLDAHAPQNANVWVVPYSPLARRYQQQVGAIRRDLTLDTSRPPDLVVLHLRRASLGPLTPLLAAPALHSFAPGGVERVRVIDGDAARASAALAD